MASHSQKPLLLNLGMLAPDFHRFYTKPDIFDADKVFDTESSDDENFEPLVIRSTAANKTDLS